jgi:LacI family transcriptional regulator, galactose operon repressor
MVRNNTRPSLKDVATLAGTSTATASRAISGRGYVSADTRKRVLEAVQELSYQPNLQARALRQRTSSTIGLVIPNLLNAYYTALADALSQLLYAKGYHLLLASTRDDPDVEQNMLSDMVGRAVDGLLWVPSSASPELTGYLLEQHTPAVAIVRRVPDDLLDAIIFEDFAGSQAATRHLINLGHERIGYIGGDIRYSSNFDRWQGFLRAMQECGMPAEDCFVKLGSTWGVWGEKATSELLELVEPPTAIYAASNAIMPGVLKTLRQHAVQLPEDMSLVCFDDLDWFSYSIPSITAVTTDHLRFAEAAVDLLMNRIQTPKLADEPSVLVQIDSELIVRQSTMAPRRHPLLQR